MKIFFWCDNALKIIDLDAHVGASKLVLWRKNSFRIWKNQKLSLPLHLYSGRSAVR